MELIRRHIILLLLGASTLACAQDTNTSGLANDSSFLEEIMRLGTPKKGRVQGFRVQVYAGGNSQAAKARAQQMEAKVRQLFPEASTYTHFVSPRWLCHVGDFLTREAATEFLQELRATGSFPEAIVVKSKVNASLAE